MDGYAKFDSAGNKEILEKEMKIFKPVTTAIGDTRVMMMPTYINGNTRRTLEPEEFINGIIKYTKDVSKDDSINKNNIWDKLKFKYANDPSEGIVVDVFKISEDGTPIRVGRPSGFDLVQLANRKTIEEIKQEKIDDAMLYAF